MLRLRFLKVFATAILIPGILLFQFACSDNSVYGELPEVKADMEFLKSSISIQPDEEYPSIVKDSGIYLAVSYHVNLGQPYPSENDIATLAASRGYTLVGKTVTNGPDYSTKKAFCHRQFPHRSIYWALKDRTNPSVVIAVTTTGLKKSEQNCSELALVETGKS